MYWISCNSTLSLLDRTRGQIHVGAPSIDPTSRRDKESRFRSVSLPHLTKYMYPTKPVLFLPALAAPHDSPIYPEFPRNLAAMPSVAACDGCHQRKERCVFDAGTGRCHQCRLQQKNCSFSRRGQRMGRPPRMRKLPYGSCEILNFDDASEEDPKQTTNTPASSDLSCPSPSYDIESESLGSADLAPCRPVAYSSDLPYSSLADLFSFIEAVYDLPIALPHTLDRSSSASPHHPVHDILSKSRAILQVSQRLCDWTYLLRPVPPSHHDGT